MEDLVPTVKLWTIYLQGWWCMPFPGSYCFVFPFSVEKIIEIATPSNVSVYELKEKN